MDIPGMAYLIPYEIERILYQREFIFGNGPQLIRLASDGGIVMIHVSCRFEIHLETIVL